MIRKFKSIGLFCLLIATSSSSQAAFKKITSGEISCFGALENLTVQLPNGRVFPQPQVVSYFFEPPTNFDAANPHDVDSALANLETIFGDSAMPFIFYPRSLRGTLFEINLFERTRRIVAAKFISETLEIIPLDGPLPDINLKQLFGTPKGLKKIIEGK